MARAEVQDLVNRLSARDTCIEEQGTIIERNLEDFAAKVGIKCYSDITPSFQVVANLVHSRNTYKSARAIIA